MGDEVNMAEFIYVLSCAVHFISYKNETRENSVLVDHIFFS